MILVDMNQISLASCYDAFEYYEENSVEGDMVRHMIPTHFVCIDKCFLRTMVS